MVKLNSERLKFKLSLTCVSGKLGTQTIQFRSYKLWLTTINYVFRSPKPHSSLIGFGSMEKSGKALPQVKLFLKVEFLALPGLRFAASSISWTRSVSRGAPSISP